MWSFRNKFLWLSERAYAWFYWRKKIQCTEGTDEVEVGEFIKVLEKYMDVYPEERDNKTLKKMYNLLDAMEIYW